MWREIVSHSRSSQYTNQQQRVFSTTCSIYDPMIRAQSKDKFQKLYRLEVDWNEEVPSKIAAQMARWLSTLTIARCVRQTSSSQLLVTQVHYFFDASEMAYGEVSYIRMGNMMSKARLTPIAS